VLFSKGTIMCRCFKY